FASDQVAELLQDGGDLVAAVGALLQVGQPAANLQQSLQGLDLAEDRLRLEVVEPAEAEDDLDPGAVAAHQVLDLVGQPRFAPDQDFVEVVTVDLEEGAARQRGEGWLRLTRQIGQYAHDQRRRNNPAGAVGLDLVGQTG